ncbi:HalOD1 output domain-containing protein [Halopiger thermotolerans]
MQRIVETVADVQGTSPSELSTPLYEAVDPDALERVLRSSDGSSLRVRFPYESCVVTVDGAGNVSAAPSQRESDSTAALLSETPLDGTSSGGGKPK